jgi:hypothetical protein
MALSSFSRRKLSMKRAFYPIGILVVAALFCLSCSPSPKKPRASAPASSQNSATVIITSGKAEANDGTSWKALEIGEVVSVGSSVRTGADSSCDLRFGSLGAVHIGASTQVQLRDINLTAGAQTTEIGLKLGDITCKVKKLTEKDHFEVRLSDSVCGVRGTEFFVRARRGKPSFVAVNEGRVAVLPPSYDAQRIKETASSPEAAEQLIAQLSEAAPALDAGEESSVSSRDMAKANSAIAELLKLIGAIPQAKGATPPARIAEAIAHYMKVSSGALGKPSKLRPESGLFFRNLPRPEGSASSDRGGRDRAPDPHSRPSQGKVDKQPQGRGGGASQGSGPAKR